MQVVPAILTYSKEEFITQFKMFLPYYKRYQIDIQDGIFVNNKTIQAEDILSIYRSQVLGIEKERPPTARTLGALAEGNLRQDPKLIIDFHLMVVDYESAIKTIFEISNYVHVRTILIHFGNHPNLDALKETYPQFEFGLVLNPEDSIETIKTKYDFSKLTDIQIMTIHPGPQGSPFIQEALIKFDQVKHENYKINTYIDGAINENTLPAIMAVENPPDFLCVGSYLTKAKNLEEHVRILDNAIKDL